LDILLRAELDRARPIRERATGAARAPELRPFELRLGALEPGHATGPKPAGSDQNQAKQARDGGHTGFIDLCN
jgi:hypothetical protein